MFLRRLLILIPVPVLVYPVHFWWAEKKEGGEWPGANISVPSPQAGGDVIVAGRDAAEALAYVIHAFQPEAKLPESEAELAALYRSTLRAFWRSAKPAPGDGMSEFRAPLKPSDSAIQPTWRHPGLPVGNSGAHPRCFPYP